MTPAPSSNPTTDKDRQFDAEAMPWLADVTRYAQSLTRDGDRAQDLVQETFLRAYTGWHTYRPGSECRGWLFTICRNTWFRDRQRAARIVDADDAELEGLAAAGLHASLVDSGLDRMFSDFDLGDDITRAIDALPEPYREAVVLVDVHDQSYEETSVTLGVPIGTVRSRLFRARRLLQESLIHHARDRGLVREPPRTRAEGNP